MKRSQINKIMTDAIELLNASSIALPPFATWGKEDWLAATEEYQELRDTMLGWDITDFGSGDYDKIGLLMFTLRNGSYTMEQYDKPYAEKILIVKNKQVTPYHFHWKKTEDIINRGGGELLVQLYNSTSDELMDYTSDVEVHIDGRTLNVKAGTILTLSPGQSITIRNGQYHQFWAEGGDLVVGEVSKVNDDRIDNRFLEYNGRFPEIEEDEEPLYYLFSELPKI